MAKTPAVRGLLAGCLVLVGSAPAFAQQPSAEQMLSPKLAPKQKDVAVSTPSADELKTCEVKLVQGSAAGSSGWLLTDAKKQPVRRFVASKGPKASIDHWSYFKDGVEVYRELDSNGNGVPDQFRWLNAGGMKWGIDVNEDGAVDYWRMISAEEVGFEAFQAVAHNDFARLKALLIGPRDIEALKLPAGQADRLTALTKGAAKKFADLVKAQPGLSSARFDRVESAPTICVPADSFGGDTDLIKYANRPLLYHTADKKHDWLHTGELIQVGLAWRLADVPTIVDPTPEVGGGGSVAATDKGDPKTKDLFEKIAIHDERYKAVANDPSAELPRLKEYLDGRVTLLRQLVAVVDAKERETWYKQIFDNLGTLAQHGDAAALKTLVTMREQVVRTMPGSNLAAYATYRELWTNYAITMSPTAKIAPKDIEKFQEKWREQLIEFVKTYDKSEDTADALYQLAMNTEFAGKDDEAKRWYQQVWTKFPDHYLAPRCKGAADRLDLLGKAMKLTGPQLQGGAPFDLAEMKGKVVLVYYWSSIYNQSVADFARLKKACADNPGKVELVSVNLDETPEAALTYLKTVPVPGIHLHQSGPNGATGLNSPLALQYGINGPMVFLISRDGRVLLRSPQVGDLEPELKKALQ
jgi:tetratricopeptide (TPR) repeat protein